MGFGLDWMINLGAEVDPSLILSACLTCRCVCPDPAPTHCPAGNTVQAG